MEQALGKPLPLGQACALHIRSDRNEADETALELDASQFSGGDAGFPPPDIWAEKLLGPLDRAARWLRGHAISRVALSGSYRLSTALAVGWSLRSTQGFELEIQTRAGSWSTDVTPMLARTLALYSSALAGSALTGLYLPWFSWSTSPQVVPG